MTSIKQIKKQKDRVNTGLNIEYDYQELRRLQKEFVDDLICLKGDTIGLAPATLRQLRVRDFPKGITIRVRKYRVKCEGRGSRVYHCESLTDLRTRDMPLYLKEFLGI